MSITTRIDENECLLKGLAQNMYQLIVTSFDPGDDSLYTTLFRTETMSLSVPKSHPFYNRKSVSPQDLEGQFLIVYHELGIWGSWIDLDLSCVDNDEDQNRQDQGTQLHHKGLQKQSEESPIPRLAPRDTTRVRSTWTALLKNAIRESSL